MATLSIILDPVTQASFYGALKLVCGGKWPADHKSRRSPHRCQPQQSGFLKGPTGGRSTFTTVRDTLLQDELKQVGDVKGPGTGLG